MFAEQLTACSFVITKAPIDDRGRQLFRCELCGRLIRSRLAIGKIHAVCKLALLDLIAEFDSLMESGDLHAIIHPADAIGEVLMEGMDHKPKKPGKPCRET